MQMPFRRFHRISGVTFLAMPLISAVWTLQGCSAPEQGQNADFYAMGDVTTVEPLPNGTFKVTCRDGSTETATQLQMARGDVCNRPEPLPQPPGASRVLCGNYREPVLIPAGRHIVSCDTVFERPVVLQPGADLVADGEWELKFGSDVFAYGEKENPIRFLLSGPAVTKQWRRIEFRGTKPLDYAVDRSYVQGALLRNVVMSGKARDLVIAKAFVTESTLQADNVAIDGGTLGDSVLRGPSNDDLNVKLASASYFVRNKLDVHTTFYTEQSFIGWNVMPSNSFFASEQSYFLFNKSASFSDTNSSIVFYGNSVSAEGGVPLAGASASSDAVIVGPFPYFLQRKFQRGDIATFPLIIADASGWRFDLALSSRPVYSVDGNDFLDVGSNIEGYYPNHAFSKEETYGLKFTTTPAVALTWPTFRIDVRN